MGQYAYGWHPSPPDQRDLLYTASRDVSASLPPKVDLIDGKIQSAPWNPCWNQGRLGSCGPHTAGENIVYDMLARPDISDVMPSRLFIYYNARQLMGTVNSDSGVNNRAMLKSLAAYGWCDESVWPYSDDSNHFKVKPDAGCYAQAATRKIGDYLSVPQDLVHMKGCLAEGFPFILGFTVYESLETPQVAETGMVPIPSPMESVLGGHDVLCVGYDDATLRFKFRNHWYKANGQPWGDGGFGYMPYSYAVSPSLAGDFWTIRGTGLSPAPVPPTPPQPPTPPAGRTIFVMGSNLKLVVDGKEV